MTRQVALGAVLGFTIMVILTSVWPQSAPPPPPPSAPLQVLQELSPQRAGENPTPEMIRPRPAAQLGTRKPTKFINPHQAVPQGVQ